MNYVDLGIIDNECRVTFEAENNLDFRLGTGKLRYTNCAAEGDYAAISRVGERDYELRIFRQGTAHETAVSPYALHFIGHQGKKYGFLSNAEFERATGIRVGARFGARARR